MLEYGWCVVIRYVWLGAYVYAVCEGAAGAAEYGVGPGYDALLAIVFAT